MRKQYLCDLLETANYAADICEYMKANGIRHTLIYPAIPYYVPGNFYCMEHKAAGHIGVCQYCSDYRPRNGTSGICSHYRLKFHRPDINKPVLLLANGRRLKAKVTTIAGIKTILTTATNRDNEP